MHMSDALLSPAVGGAAWAAAAALGARCAAVLRRDPDDRRVPLMGVLGAFVFAAQMVNFSIPLTGSSGHLAGGLLLAVLLGPHAAFLVLASVLAVQALFFADGGLLALGCNLLNLGLWPCFVFYPLVFRPLAGPAPGRGRLVAASLAAGALGLALGAAGVVVETAASGISSLPVGPFLLLMLPLHLAIGLVEGLITAAVLLALGRARPELLRGQAAQGRPLRPVLVAVAVAAVATAGVLSWFASARPDGLEWSLARAAPGIGAPASAVHALLARLQGHTALLPDYGAAGATPGSWPAPQAGTSAAGLLGAGLTLGVAAAVGSAIRRSRRR